MRSIVVAILSVFFIISAGYAAWEGSFATVYKEKGIDEAVVNALSEGASPERIIKVALPLEGLPQEVLVKALFCSLAQPDAIREAARANSISDAKIEEGYQLALSVCARQMQENLNSALQQEARFPELAPSDRSRKTTYGSPWKFE